MSDKQNVDQTREGPELPRPSDIMGRQPGGSNPPVAPTPAAEDLPPRSPTPVWSPPVPAARELPWFPIAKFKGLQPVSEPHDGWPKGDVKVPRMTKGKNGHLYTKMTRWGDIPLADRQFKKVTVYRLARRDGSPDTADVPATIIHLFVSPWILEEFEEMLHNGGINADIEGTGHDADQTVAPKKKKKKSRKSGAEKKIDQPTPPTRRNPRRGKSYNTTLDGETDKPGRTLLRNALQGKNPPNIQNEDPVHDQSPAVARPPAVVDDSVIRPDLPGSNGHIPSHIPDPIAPSGTTKVSQMIARLRRNQQHLQQPYQMPPSRGPASNLGVLSSDPSLLKATAQDMTPLPETPAVSVPARRQVFPAYGEGQTRIGPAPPRDLFGTAAEIMALPATSSTDWIPESPVNNRVAASVPASRRGTGHHKTRPPTSFPRSSNATADPFSPTVVASGSSGKQPRAVPDSGEAPVISVTPVSVVDRKGKQRDTVIQDVDLEGPDSEMMDVDEDLHELSVPDVEDESMSMETQATPVLVTSKPTQVQARVNNKPKVPSPDELSRPEDPNTARPRSNNGLRAVGPYAPHFDAQLQKREPRGTPSVSPSPVASQECALAILAGGVAQPAQAVRGPEGMTLRSRPLPYAPSSHTTVAAAIRTQPSEPQPAVAAQPEPPKKKSGRGGRRAGAGRPPKRKRKLPETAAVAPATPAPTVVPSAADNAQAVLTSAVGGPTPESSGRALRPRQLASKTVLPPSSQGSPSIAYSQAELAPVEIKKSNISGCCEGSGRKRKARTELPRPGGGNPPGPPAIHTPTTEAAGSSTNGSSSQEATLFSSIFARWLAASSASVANGPGPGSKIGGTGASIRTGTGTFWREISVMDNLRLLSDVGSSPPYFPITPAAQSPTAALDDLRASETGRNDNSPSSSKLYGPAHTIFPRSPSAHQEEDSDLGSPAFENGWSKDDGDHIDAKSHGSASPVRPRAASVSPAQQTPDAADDNLASPGVSSDSTIVVDSSQSTISLDSPHARTHAGPGADASPTASPDTELLDLVPSAPGSVSSSASSSDGPQPSPDVEHEPESRQPSEEATSPKSSGEENSQKRPAEDEAAGQSPQKLQKTLTYSSARFASQAADVPLPAAGNGNAPSKPQLSSGSERRLLQPSCQVPPGRWTTGGFVMNLPPAPPTTRVRAYKPRSTMGGRNDASWPMGLEPPATPTRAPVETPDKRSTLPSSSAADVSLPLSELKSLPPTPCPPPKAALPQAKPVPDSRPVLTGLPSKPVQPVPVERSIPASPAMSAFPAVPPRPAVNAASASLSTIRRDPSVGPIAPSLGSDISRGPVRASESVGVVASAPAVGPSQAPVAASTAAPLSIPAAIRASSKNAAVIASRSQRSFGLGKFSMPRLSSLPTLLPRLAARLLPKTKQQPQLGSGDAADQLIPSISKRSTPSLFGLPPRPTGTPAQLFTLVHWQPGSLAQHQPVTPALQPQSNPPSHTHRAPVETSLPPRPKRPSPAQRISIPGLGSYSDWHRYTPEEDAQIVALHQRGLSFQKIAPRIGGRHTWNSVATHFNLYLRDGGAGKRRREKREADKATRPADGSEKKERVPWKSWTEAEQRRLLELKSMGMSNEAVGDVIGRTYNAVRLKYHDIRKNGISVDDGNEEQER